MDELRLRWRELQRQPLGRILPRERTRPGFWKIDFGRVRKRKREQPYPRFVYSFRGEAFRSHADAENALRVVVAAWLQGGEKADAIARIAPDSVPARCVGNLLAQWWSDKLSKVKAGDLSWTYVRSESFLKSDGHIGAFWNERTVIDITTSAMDDFDAFLRGRALGPKTRKNVIGVFGAFVRWLYRRGMLARLPSMPIIPVAEHVPTVLSTAVQDQVLAHIAEPRRGCILAMVHAGARPNEARAIRVRDLQDGWLVLCRAVQGPYWDSPHVDYTKTRSFRRVPVSTALAEWIEKYADLTDPEALLFPNPNTKKTWSHHNLRDTWDRACKKVGVAAPLYSGTKHSTGTAAVNRGVPLEVLQKFFGHADIRSTQRYARLADESLRAVLR